MTTIMNDNNTLDNQFVVSSSIEDCLMKMKIVYYKLDMLYNPYYMNNNYQ